VTSLPVVRDEYIRPDICMPCGGRCCKHAPGAAMPEDFGAPDDDALRTALKERLATGEWSIDWWDGDPREGQNEIERAYYLRPATRQGRGRIFDPSYGGVCNFFQDGKGCRIFDTRPTGCRGVEPSPTGPCAPRYASKQDAAIAWIPYIDVILSVAEELDEWPGEEPSWLAGFTAGAFS